MKNRLIKTLNIKRFKLVLLLEGLLVGILAGLVIVGYRICLTNGALWLQRILAYCKQSIFTIIIWFVILFVIALLSIKLPIKSLILKNDSHNLKENWQVRLMPNGGEF